MEPESSNTWHAAWAKAQADTEGLRLYALIDCAAAGRRITGLLRETQLRVECLFNYPVDAPIAAATPKLVAIENPTASPLGRWLLAQMPVIPVGTLLASALDLQPLAAHLRACVDVELKEIDSMFMAVWDPAILGTLVGQADDATLQIPGPVLRPEQVAGLLAPIVHWWYWDREGHLHDAVPANFEATTQSASVPWIVLDEKQVDALVEASVPDHLLQHIRQNQPELLERLPDKHHYRFVQQQLRRARKHGIEGTGDLVNYVCIALAFGSAFDEVPSMAALLAQVKAGSMTFDEALDKTSEDELAAQKNAAVLL